MPCLRPRMRCRRGVSRGQTSFHQPTPSSNSGSSSASDDPIHPLALRRGRVRGHGRVHNSGHDGPLVLPSNSPPPGRMHSGSSIRQTSQHAKLRFHCTSVQSIITAFITVSLREEIPYQTPARPASPSPPRAPCSTGRESLPDPSSLPSQAVLSNDAEDPNLKDGSQASMADNSNDYEYACRIVEEPMSPAHEG